MDIISYVYSELRKFNRQIIIDGSFGNADFDNVIGTYPRLVAFVNSYRIRKSFLTRQTIIDVEYKNRSLDYNHVYEVYDDRSIDRALRLTLTRYDETMIIVASDQNILRKMFNRETLTNVSTEFPYLKGAGTNRVVPLRFGGRSFVYVEAKLLYHVPVSKLKEQEEIVNKEVIRIAKMLFEPGMPKEVKALLAHNYLCDLATYDPNYLKSTITFNPDSHGAYGALISHVCVCHGYADAYRRILNQGSVTCETIRGVHKAGGENHAWNLVRLDDGNYYHVDVTFDDQYKTIYNFFMKDDAFMRRDRSWNESEFPKASGMRNALLIARSYIRLNRMKLLGRGIKPSILNADEY